MAPAKHWGAQAPMPTDVSGLMPVQQLSDGSGQFGRVDRFYQKGVDCHAVAVERTTDIE